MKTIYLSRLIFIMPAFFRTGIVAFPQVTDYPVCDTLVAGDTTIVRYTLETSGYAADQQSACLWPDFDYPWWTCEWCRPDTIESFKITGYQASTFNYYFSVPEVTIPGKYTLYIFCHTDSGWEEFFTQKMLWIMSGPAILEHPENIMACPGDDVSFNPKLIGSDYLYYKWFRNGSEITGATDDNLVINNVQQEDAGLYYCIVHNWYGTDTSETAQLTVADAPAAPGPPAGPDKFCPGTQNTVYTINSDALATGYDWQLFPEYAGSVNSSDTTAEIDWAPSFNGRAVLRVALQNEFCEPVLSDSLLIRIPGPTSTPPICIIGIDEATGKYRIVWEKRESNVIREYKIYRESNQSDVYLEIGSTLQDELSVFVDSSSAPDILPHRYKISVVNTCGSESELSAYHQTMHLTANLSISKDVNLLWSGYMGIPFPAYVIYRGTHPDSMTLLMQVPSTVTSFTDDDPPSGMIYYQVGMSNPSGCLPSRKTSPDYSLSLSNTEEVLNPSGTNDISEEDRLTIYPNPSGTDLYILLPANVSCPAKFEVLNIIGVPVLEGIIDQRSYRLYTGSLPEGMYILKTDGAGMTCIKPFSIFR
jgi:hypothetical protein